jgi:hypothetical protein
MQYVQGEIETQRKSDGTLLHEQLIRMKPTTLNSLIRDIKRRKSLLASFSIVARFSKITIAGKPDAIFFLKSSPKYLIELKTTKGDTTRLWEDQATQVQVYRFILEEMGFDCSNLELVVIRKQMELSEMDRVSFLKESIKELLIGAPKLMRSKRGSTTHLVEYNRQEVLAKLNWAEAYWLSQREPIPTQNIAKCRSCEFNDVCTHSQTRAYGQKLNDLLFVRKKPH